MVERIQVRNGTQLIALWMTCVAVILTQLWNLRSFAGLPERVTKIESRQELTDREGAVIREQLLFRLTKIEVLLQEHMKDKP
jgi:hypothetical protein